MEKKIGENRHKGLPKKKAPNRTGVRVDVKIDREVYLILKKAKDNHPGDISYTKLISYAIKKAFVPWRTRMAQKIAENQRKADYWRKMIETYDEVHGEP